MGRVLAVVVGTTSSLAAFAAQLLLAVWLTPPDVLSGSRAPGVLLDLLFGVIAVMVGVTVGRAVFRWFAA